MSASKVTWIRLSCGFGLGTGNRLPNNLMSTSGSVALIRGLFGLLLRLEIMFVLQTVGWKFSSILDTFVSLEEVLLGIYWLMSKLMGVVGVVDVVILLLLMLLGVVAVVVVEIFSRGAVDECAESVVITDESELRW